MLGLMLGFGDQQVAHKSQLYQALCGALGMRSPWLKLWGTNLWLREHLESQHRG